MSWLTSGTSTALKFGFLDCSAKACILSPLSKRSFVHLVALRSAKCPSTELRGEVRRLYDDVSPKQGGTKRRWLTICPVFRAARRIIGYRMSFEPM